MLRVGSAGGANACLSLDLSLERLRSGWIGRAALITGLKGGHSGLEIHHRLGTLVLRYGPWRVTAVIDQNAAGRTILDQQGPDCPFFAGSARFTSPAKGAAHRTAPTGRALSEHFRAVIREAIDSGLHVINGLHTFLNAQYDLRALASKRDVLLWDVRHVPDGQSVARQLTHPKNVKVVITVERLLDWKNVHCFGNSARFVSTRQKCSVLATGQTGIVISGFGILLDRVIGDFMAGAVEKAILELIETENPDWSKIPTAARTISKPSLAFRRNCRCCSSKALHIAFSFLRFG